MSGHAVSIWRTPARDCSSKIQMSFSVSVQIPSPDYLPIGLHFRRSNEATLKGSLDSGCPRQEEIAEMLSPSLRNGWHFLVIYLFLLKNCTQGII